MFHFCMDVNNILLPGVPHQTLTSMENILELFTFHMLELRKEKKLLK